MGTAQSANRKGLFRPSARYQRLSDCSPLLTQHQNSNLVYSMEIEDQVQAYWEKSSALEKEIGGLKTNFCRLETMLQTSISKLQSTPTYVTKEVNTNLEQKVDKLKKSIDGVITGREADKRVYSAAFSNQGVEIKRVAEKNICVEKQVEELKTRINGMTSSMVEMAAIIAELKHEFHQPKEAPVSSEIRIPQLLKMAASKDEVYIILVFLIALLIGLKLTLYKQIYVLLL